MSAHAGADTRAGEFVAHGVCRAAFESLDERRYRQGGRVSDEQVDVVDFALNSTSSALRSAQTSRMVVWQ